MPLTIRTMHDYAHMARKAFRLPGIALVALSASLGASAFAADGNKMSDAEVRYQSERAACNSRSGEDRATCLREAAAARAEAKRGELGGAQNSYEKNALARCDALPAADRDVCARRIRGEGVTKGSVAEGGIYREYKEVTLPSVTSPGSASPGSSTGEKK
jgi:hypothetical protein